MHKATWVRAGGGIGCWGGVVGCGRACVGWRGGGVWCLLCGVIHFDRSHREDGRASQKGKIVAFRPDRCAATRGMKWIFRHARTSGSAARAATRTTISSPLRGRPPGCCFTIAGASTDCPRYFVLIAYRLPGCAEAGAADQETIELAVEHHRCLSTSDRSERV